MMKKTFCLLDCKKSFRWSTRSFYTSFW